MVVSVSVLVNSTNYLKRIAELCIDTSPQVYRSLACVNKAVNDLVTEYTGDPLSLDADSLDKKKAKVNATSLVLESLICGKDAELSNRRQWRNKVALRFDSLEDGLKKLNRYPPKERDSELFLELLSSLLAITKIKARALCIEFQMSPADIEIYNESEKVLQKIAKLRPYSEGGGAVC